MILVLRALGIGDLATGVPAVRAVRRAFPDEELALAAPAWLAPLVKLVGAVDRLIPVEGLDGWIDASPKLAINLHGRGPQSHRLLERWPTWAFANAEAGFTDGAVWRFEEHEVARWCRMLAWYGIEADPDDLRIERPDVDPDLVGATVLHVGAKAPRRRWPRDRFATVARQLTAFGHRVVITGSSAERERALAVAAMAGLGPDRVLAGRHGVGELAATIACARLLISGDTGAAHLATAYGTPSVVLFGPMPPRLWGPPPDRPQHRCLHMSPYVTDIPASVVLDASLDLDVFHGYRIARHRYSPVSSG
jgi:ADP-heptose:LPS heptosyltransferase